MNLNDSFKRRLRELRKERKETQVQVALAIGTTGRYYQKLESGECLPGLEYSSGSRRAKLSLSVMIRASRAVKVWQ